MSDYGTIAEVAAYVRRLANSAGTFDATTRPTQADVELFLTRRSNMLNAWLATAGYTIPVTDAQAKSVLDHYAAVGAACDVERTQRTAGASEEDNARADQFCKEFSEAKTIIASGGLAALGATLAGASATLAGLYVGGKTRTGQRLRPIFTRASFGNEPTRESGEKEPGWQE